MIEDHDAMDYFPAAMAFVWRSENDGQEFHQTPYDPGGATNQGVTFTTWSAWQRLHAAPINLVTFKALRQSDFLPLYRAMFWNAARCDAFGVIGIQVFDAAVNCGPGHAVGFLQHVLGIPTNNVADRPTIAAYAIANPVALARALCAEREAFYATRPNARYFQKGWNRRAESCREYTLSLLNSSPAEITADDLNAAVLSKLRNFT